MEHTYIKLGTIAIMYVRIYGPLVFGTNCSTPKQELNILYSSGMYQVRKKMGMAPISCDRGRAIVVHIICPPYSILYCNAYCTITYAILLL